MLTKAEQFLIFCDKIECDIEKETQIEHGKNLIVSLKGEKSIVTIFDNGNVRIQGKDNSLKQMLLQWNNKLTQTSHPVSGAEVAIKPAKSRKRFVSAGRPARKSTTSAEISSFRAINPSSSF